MKVLVSSIALMLSTAAAAPLFNTIPDPLPPSLPSLGYQATSTQEFGGQIQMAGDLPAALAYASVTLVSLSLESTYEPVGTSAGFIVPITLNLYHPGAGGAVGSLITSVTVDANILWRPEASPGCGSGWRALDNNCYGGFAQTVSFALSGVSVPAEVIYGLAFNTPNHGSNPTGVPGPAQSLNLGMSSTSPAVGSIPEPGTVYWNTSNPAMYTDGGAGGINTLRLDTGWEPYSAAVCFDDGAGCPGTNAAVPVPEPRTYGLLAAGLVLLTVRGAASFRR